MLCFILKKKKKKTVDEVAARFEFTISPR